MSSPQRMRMLGFLPATPEPGVDESVACAATAINTAHKVAANWIGVPFVIMSAFWLLGIQVRSPQGRRVQACGFDPNVFPLLSLKEWRTALPAIHLESVRLLSFVALHHRLDLLLHCVEVERGRLLHRRKVDGRLSECRHLLLNKNESPELAGVELISITKCAVQRRFTSDHWESLERVLSNILDSRHVGHDLRTRPTSRLEEELKLEIIQSQGAQFGPREVEQFVSF